MSNRVVVAGSYALDKYIIGRPIVSVPSSMFAGAFTAKETSIDTRYERGLFDGPTPMFVIDDTVEIYDDDATRIFSGYISSIVTSRGITSLRCNTLIHKKMSGVINVEATGLAPTTILKAWLDSVGISCTNIDYTAMEYSSMLANIYCPTEGQVKGYDLLSAISDMTSADISIVDNAIVFYDRDASYTGYTISKIMNFPEQVDDGTNRYWQGTSIRYLYDGEVPYVQGDSTERAWAPDFSSGSAFQLVGTQSAAIASTIRIARYGSPHPVYKIKIRATAAPIILGAWYVVNSGTMAGNYRLIAYDTDGECYWLQMEAE